MAHYIRSDYYTESFMALAETVHEIDSCYDNGSTFIRDLKLIIAQIAAKDWTPIDKKRVALIVDILKRNLISAVIMGCLCVTHTNNVQTLVNFDTQEEVPDLPIVVGDFSYNVRDSGLCLAASKESSISISIRDVICQIKSIFESFLPRKDNNGENWHSSFEKFLEALAQRRYDRVKDWIESNTVYFSDNDEVQKLRFNCRCCSCRIEILHPSLWTEMLCVLLDMSA
ncbi:hypothetical protein SUGI_0672610 [Cryptomeria japonica]|nr:hypothetical protein SUGI_0672610 [Cryptomeria japonica]